MCCVWSECSVFHKVVRDKYVPMGVTISMGKLKELQEIPALTPLYPPPISYEVSWD
jgi:hypothetical protein